MTAMSVGTGNQCTSKTMRPPLLLPDPAGDADLRYATEEHVEAVRHENDALRRQVTALSYQHTLEMQDMNRKMSAMLARLDALTGS